MMVLPLIVVITASFLMLWLGRKKPAWLLWMGVPLGLGVMIKGAMGLPPYLVIALFVMLTWRRRAWPGRELLLGLALSALIALPWHVGQALLHGRAFFDDFLVRQVVARVTTVIDTPPSCRRLLLLPAGDTGRLPGVVAGHHLGRCLWPVPHRAGRGRGLPPVVPVGAR
jgi:4-amino-4-deoxy-L-arabinose transferase-like glycosyltransferase